MKANMIVFFRSLRSTSYLYFLLSYKWRLWRGFLRSLGDRPLQSLLHVLFFLRGMTFTFLLQALFEKDVRQSMDTYHVCCSRNLSYGTIQT